MIPPGHTLRAFAATATALCLASCTKVEFDNPYDSRGTTYIDLRLEGDNPLVLSVGDDYVEPGATAKSEVYGDLTEEIETSSDVTSDFAGSYSVKYTVSDPAGNTVSAVRTVTVVPQTERDTRPPVITLKGTDTLILTVGETYHEPGASAYDNVDKDITDKISIDTSSLDTDRAGTCSVTYTVADQAGNTTSVTRIVIVRTGPAADTIAPVISLMGPDTVRTVVGEEYEDGGATAHDEADGDITDSIVTESTVDTAAPGIYTVVYRVTDRAGNAAVRSRVVIVEGEAAVDTVAPVITLAGGDTVSLTAGEQFVEPGYTATDDIDGDLTAAVVVDAGELDTETAGTYTVNYSVTDRAGNTASAQRAVIVQSVAADTVAPVITLAGGDTVSLTAGEQFVEPGYTATDDIDGDLTAAVVVDTGELNTEVAGIYPLHYSVTDRAGNTAVRSRVVIVEGEAAVDTVAPVITLAGDDTVSLTAGEQFVEPGYTATDDIDGDLTAAVVVDAGELDTETAGTYTVNYSVTDRAGNAAVRSRVVIVEGEAAADTVAPVITLAGGDTVTIRVGEAFVDPGATALDAVDGDLTDEIVVDPSGVDTAVAGTYTVGYRVADAAGNTGSATRTVRVLASSGNLLDTYGVPTAGPLPALDNVAYSTVRIEGTGGPSLANFREFTINWDPANDGLYVFAFNTDDGNPDWYVPLHGAVDHTFGESAPGFTLQDSGFEGLDGTYFVALDGESLVWVSTDGSFALVFVP